MFKKCLSSNTLVRLFNGTTKPVSQITTNDYLIGTEGQPVKITNYYYGYGPMYRIKQDNGIEYVVNENHKLILIIDDEKYKLRWNFRRFFWKLNYIYNSRPQTVEFCGKIPSSSNKHSLKINGIKFIRAMKRKKGFFMYDDIIEVKVSDYIKLSPEIKNALHTMKISLEYLKKDIIIDPYILGIWLSFGDIKTGSIHLTSNDLLVNYIYDFAYSKNLTVSVVVDTDSTDTKKYVIGNSFDVFKTELANLNLLKFKHIPTKYHHNDSSVRLKLLAGLIDSIGYQYMNDSYEIAIYFENPDLDILAFDIVLLCRSLGLNVNQSNIGNIIKIQIQGNIFEIPVLDENKKIKPKFKINDYYQLNNPTSPIEILQIENGSFVTFRLEGDSNFIGLDYTVL